MRETVRAFEPKVDLAATVAACAVVPLILVEMLARDPRWLFGATLANWAIWFSFLLDAVVKLFAFGPAWLRRGSAWFNIALVALTYPGLGALFASARLLRLARVGRSGRALRALRVARIGSLTSRALVGLRRVLDPDAFPFVALAVVLVVTIGGAALYLIELEPNGTSVFDALWWAVTTVTTVGYGDIVPTTPAGRAVAAIVMIVGVTFTSLLTAQIAAHLSRTGQRRADGEVAVQIHRLNAKLDLLVEQLAHLEGHLGGLTPGSPTEVEDPDNR
jgi:voltage-gated potassium channel